jgi:hypothetical protein
MLGNCKPLPIILGLAVQVRDGTLLKEAQDIALILGQQYLFPSAAATNFWNQFVT